MVVGLLLSQTFYCNPWKSALPLGHCLAAKWQRRCQLWLAEWADRGGSALQTADPLGDPALAKARPDLASGARHHNALEPLLSVCSLGRGSRQSRPAAVENLRAFQRQRQRRDLDRSAGEKRSSPGRFQCQHPAG